MPESFPPGDEPTNDDGVTPDAVPGDGPQPGDFLDAEPQFAGFAPEPAVEDVERRAADDRTVNIALEGRVRTSGRRKEVHRARSFFRVAGVVALALVMVVGLGGVYFYRHLNTNINTIDLSVLDNRPTEPAVSLDGSNDQPLNILLMGTDDRTCDGCNVDGLGEIGARSDTTILMHISADRSRVYAVSIPRDSIVARPSCTDPKTGKKTYPATADKWNAAYTYGGPLCTISQFEHTTGIRIDHFAVINFGGFQSMVNAVGGVTVCVPEAWHSDINGITVPAGTTKMDGAEALDYVRIRYGVGDGTDLGREKRQQAFLGALTNSILSANTLTNPIKIIKLLNAVTGSLTVDTGFDVRQMASLAYQLRNASGSNVKFLTLPWQYATKDGISGVSWRPQATALWNEIKLDQPLDADLLDGSLSADDVPGVVTTPTATSTPTPSMSPTAPVSSTVTSPSSAPTSIDGLGGQQVLENAGLCVSK